MFITRLIKSPKYFFYSLMAVLFIIFVHIILLSGRNIYTKERDKLFFAANQHELAMTKNHFETRLDDINLEIRRIVNLMKDMKMLDSPKHLQIQNFISDFLFFDHHFLSAIMFDNNYSPLFRVNAQTVSDKYKPFIADSAFRILSHLKENNDLTNRLNLSKELNTVYMVKDLNDSFGNSSRQIAFFFTPDLLLTYLPENYALIHENNSLIWSSNQSLFPNEVGFIKPDSSFTSISDTTAVIYAPLSGQNADYYLSALIDTTEVKISLLHNTIVSTVVFSLFFFTLILFFLIYLRNMQIGQLIDTQKATVVCLANLAEFKDNETADHLERTRHYGTLLTKTLKTIPKYKKQISKEYLDNIGFASVLHDIGKVGIPDEVLKKSPASWIRPSSK